MAEESFEERTEPASARKKQEARERGHVAKSVDLSTSLVLLAAIISIYVFHKDIYKAFRYTLEHSFAESITANEMDVMNIAFRSLQVSAISVLPILLILVVVGFCSGLIQFGFIFSLQQLEFNFDKVNPINGFKKLFSLRQFVRFIMGFLKLMVVGIALLVILWREINSIMSLNNMEVPQIVSYLLYLIFKISLTVAILLILLAIIDYIYQKFAYEKGLMMSKFEVKEEMKRYEGDPKVKEKRKQLYKQIAYKKMLKKIPKATVVITNPTEIAVALKYDHDSDIAPVVVAKGQRFLAQKIREIASDNKVPIVERRELARALFKQCEVGDAIPVSLFEACAQVLSYVYALKYKFS
ncbi:MAG: flagellar biosynthesis protein FlhB [Planctomycetes bacterium]|nr:flagellar biosynthesis protein FlhB [Planctomycetota bacterium]